MGEIQIDSWWKNVESSDGDTKRTSREQLAIDLLNKNRAILPRDRFIKLVEQTIIIIQNSRLQEQQIRAEFQAARDRLVRESQLPPRYLSPNTPKNACTPGSRDDLLNIFNIDPINATAEVAGKAINVATNLGTEAQVKQELGLLLSTASLDEIGYSDSGVHAFNTEKGNFVISISNFERILQTEKNVRNINSRALANYFAYLKSKGQLTPEVLIQKFGNDTLFGLGKLWDAGGNEYDGNDRLIAKKMLIKKGMWPVIEVIKTFSSPENFLKKIQTLNSEDKQKIALLFLEKNLNSIRETFKDDLKKKFITNNPSRIHEADKIIDGMLEELMKHKGLKGLAEINKIFDKYDQQYRLGLNIKDATAKTYEMCTAESKCTIAKLDAQLKEAKDPKEQKKLTAKRKVEERQMKDAQMAMKANEKMTDKERQDLISGKKDITQVVHEIRKRDREFNRDYVVWEQQDKQLQVDIAKANQEASLQKTPTSSTQTKLPTPHHHTSINGLEIGQDTFYNLSRSGDSDKQDRVHIKKIGDNNYELQVAHHDTVILTKQETEGYLKSFRFLENSGLGYLIRNIQPKTLSHIISLAGKDGHRVNNRDGDFTEYERFYFLKTLGKVLGIEKMNETINFPQSKELLKKTFYLSGSTTEGGFEKIATKIGLIQNGGLNIDELTRRIKQA